jgi:diguanylate cyclase (GGDEF)-like protein
MPNDPSSQPPKSGYLANPAIMDDAERLLAGRTRDIKLAGKIKEAFLDRSWRQTAKIIRSWMIWVVVLDALALSMNIYLLPRSAALSMLVPGAIIPVVALVVYLIWRKRRSHPFLGWSLSIGMFLILCSVCLMGAAASGHWQERYLYVMLFVGIAGIATFSIPMQHIWSIAISCLGLYLLFQLQNPLLQPLEALSTFFFFASGVTAVVVARQTMTVLAMKSFLLELRAAAHLEALTQANERLDWLSKVDPLTGAANRRWMSELFAELASSSVTSPASISILMCDIDHFKALNDHFGHAEGDRCLVQIAAIIASSVRSGSGYVARYGGEEFLIILPGTSEEDAAAIAERIRNAVAQAALPNPGSPFGFLTISIGLAARTPNRDWTPDELQWEADAALYKAKEAGRDQVRAFAMNALGAV